MTEHIRKGIVAGAIATLIVSTFDAAQAVGPTTLETFAGTTVNLTPDSGEPLKIEIFRWSPDMDRDALLTAVKQSGESAVATALEKSPTAGYIWGSGSLGYRVRYAQKILQPDGGERIILITDRPLGSGGIDPWKPSGSAAVPPYPFTLVELRLNKQGRGAGKMSLAGIVAVDTDAQTIALKNYADAPLLIEKVSRIASSTGSS